MFMNDQLPHECETQMKSATEHGNSKPKAIRDRQGFDHAIQKSSGVCMHQGVTRPTRHPPPPTINDDYELMEDVQEDSYYDVISSDQGKYYWLISIFIVTHI